MRQTHVLAIVLWCSRRQPQDRAEVHDGSGMKLSERHLRWSHPQKLMSSFLREPSCRPVLASRPWWRGPVRDGPG
jgi:hypothetical protein